MIKALRQTVENFGQRNAANKIGISRDTLTALLEAESPNIPLKLISAINRAISELNSEAEILDIRQAELLQAAKMEIGRIGLGDFAAAVGIDPSNISKIISGRRRANGKLLDRISGYFAERDGGSAERR